MSSMYDVSYYGNIVGSYANIAGMTDNLPDHVKGYLWGLIDIQRGRYEDLFIKDHLPDYVCDSLQKICPLPERFSSMNTKDAYLEYLVLPELTFYDRRLIFQAVGEKAKIHFFSIDCNMEMSCSIDHAEDHSGFEDICKKTAINIVIPDRKINEAMSESVLTASLSGSFVLFPYSSVYERFIPDFADSFVFFYDLKDAASKVEYYLDNESERLEMVSRSQKAVIDLLNSTK